MAFCIYINYCNKKLFYFQVMSHLCLCPVCKGKKVSHTTWCKHSVFLTKKDNITIKKPLTQKKRKKDNLNFEHELNPLLIQDATISTNTMQHTLLSSSALLSDLTTSQPTLDVQDFMILTDSIDSDLCENALNNKDDSIRDLLIDDDYQLDNKEQENSLQQFSLHNNMSIISFESESESYMTTSSTVSLIDDNNQLDTKDQEDTLQQLGLDDDISIASSESEHESYITTSSTVSHTAFASFSRPTPINIYNSNLDATIQWITIWLLLFQHITRLPKTAIELLFGFFASVLLYLDQSQFTVFPTNNHQATRMLEIDKKFTKFIVCPKCHHLFWPNEHPNETSQAFCSVPNCGQELKKGTKTSKGRIIYKVLY